MGAKGSMDLLDRKGCFGEKREKTKKGIKEGLLLVATFLIEETTKEGRGGARRRTRGTHCTPGGTFHRKKPSPDYFRKALGSARGGCVGDGATVRRKDSMYSL